MNQLEQRIRRELHAAGERIPESIRPTIGAVPKAKRRRQLRGPVAGIAAMAAVVIAVGGLSVVLGESGSGLEETTCEKAATVEISDGDMEIRATGGDLDVWGLLLLKDTVQHGVPVSFRIGDEIKIVWRVGGEGDLELVAKGPNGTETQPVSGPVRHFGSSWDRPGDEWGSVWEFPSAGCWTVVLERGGQRAEVVVRVTEADVSSLVSSANAMGKVGTP